MVRFLVFVYSGNNYDIFKIIKSGNDYVNALHFDEAFL